MYSQFTPEPIQVQIMQDLLLIEVTDFTQEAVYMIKNETGQTIRKGRFKGNSTQLNLFHLPSGHYRLGLHHLDEAVTCHFEKHDGDYVFSGMYADEEIEKIA
jgi:hypothetical protein